ncbi:MAG: polysaccharide biosynthesis C-terminal domain-containing protein [Spirochaetes bacterium]|nr:polysaccharide biosynthesis C-terminal domain-containing protein [Spirochaetota bacterium]
MDKEKNIHSGSHFKKIITKGSWYLFASIAVKAMAILILPVITRLLSKHDIGVLDTLETIKQLLPIFISLSLDEAYYRFYFNHNKTQKEIKTYVSTYFWIITTWGIFVVFISLLIGKLFLTDLFKVNYFPFIPLTMTGPLLIQLKTLGEVYLKQKLKSEFISITEIIVYAVYYGLYLFFLLIPKMGAESKIYAFFISDILAFVIFSIILLKDRLIGFYFDIKIFIEGISYSGFLILNQAMVWISGLSDRLLIGIFKNFSSTGIYSVGYKLGQAHMIFSDSVFKVYKPIMFSMFVNNHDEAVSRLERFIPSFFFVMYWIAFSIAFFSKEIITILASEKFYEAYKIVPIVAAAYLFQSLYKPFYNLISFYKRTWIFLVGSIIQAGSNFILNLILIPIYDRIAAAWTTLICFIIYFLWLFFWSRRFVKLRINWKILIYTVFVSIVMLSVYYLLILKIPYNLILSIVIKTLLILSALFVCYLFKLVELPFSFRKNQKK